MSGVVQTTAFSTRSSTSPATNSFATTPTVGNAVIVIVTFDDNYAPGSVTSISDNQSGNTFSLVKAQNDSISGDNCRTEIWWCSSLAAASGTYTVSVAYSGTLNTEVALLEVSGLTGIDQTGGVGNTGTSVTASASAANTNANDLVVAAISLGGYATNSALSVPPTTGYTTIATDTGTSSGYARNCAYKTVSAIETSGAHWSWTGSQEYAALLATFKFASSGAIGTAAIIEGPDSVSGTGSITIPGSAAITEGDDTVSASGSLSVSGSASITEGVDAVAGTGTAGAVGTAAITEGHDTVAGTGALSVTGTAGITEGADAVAGTGAMSVTGTASITEGNDAVAGTGAQSVTGTALITEGADTVVASGTASTGAVGTAAITEGADTVSASGGLALSGIAAIVEGGDIVVASGGIGISGSASILEGTDTVEASGNLPGGMPNVVGLNFYQALEVLQSAGIYQPLVAYAFAPSSITVKWATSTLTPGFVSAQSIPPGGTASPGQALTLTVSRFPFSCVIDMPADWKQVN